MRDCMASVSLPLSHRPLGPVLRSCLPVHLRQAAHDSAEACDHVRPTHAAMLRNNSVFVRRSNKENILSLFRSLHPQFGIVPTHFQLGFLFAPCQRWTALKPARPQGVQCLCASKFNQFYLRGSHKLLIPRNRTKQQCFGLPPGCLRPCKNRSFGCKIIICFPMELLANNDLRRRARLLDVLPNKAGIVSMKTWVFQTAFGWHGGSICWYGSRAKDDLF